MFRVIEQMGKVRPQLCWFIALKYVVTLLIGSGATQNVVKLAALEKRPTSYKFLRKDGKREAATVRLANSALVKPKEFRLDSPSSLVTFLAKKSLHC